VLESHSHALTKRLERPACELSAIVIQEEFWGPEAVVQCSRGFSKWNQFHPFGEGDP